MLQTIITALIAGVSVGCISAIIIYYLVIGYFKKGKATIEEEILLEDFERKISAFGEKVSSEDERYLVKNATVVFFVPDPFEGSYVVGLSVEGKEELGLLIAKIQDTVFPLAKLATTQ